MALEEFSDLETKKIPFECSQKEHVQNILSVIYESCFLMKINSVIEFLLCIIDELIYVYNRVPIYFLGWTYRIDDVSRQNFQLVHGLSLKFFCERWARADISKCSKYSPSRLREPKYHEAQSGTKPDLNQLILKLYTRLNNFLLLLLFCITFLCSWFEPFSLPTIPMKKKLVEK